MFANLWKEKFYVKWNRNKTIVIINTIIILIAILLIGPLDFFVHGYYCEEIDCGQIAVGDVQRRISLENNIYQMSFSPQKNHFAGFEIYLADQPDNNSGSLVLNILDERKNNIDTIYADLNKIPGNSWYKLYSSTNLKKDKIYTLRFSIADCAAAPSLQTVDRFYLPAETLAGNILLGYAYAQPTFSFQTKILIVMFLIAVWGWVCSFFLNSYYKKVIRRVTNSILMISILAWNYMYNSMDYNNKNFWDFQSDSEMLITGMLYADQIGVHFQNKAEVGYNLGRYYDLKGPYISYGISYITDDYWIDGYSRTETAIIVPSTIYSREVAKVGNYIVFPNGDVFSIVNITDDGTNILIYLDGSEILTPAKYGSLDAVAFFDSDHQQLDSGLITAYKSQYGLQGKIFRQLAKYIVKDQVVANLNLLCSMATAAVFVLITFLLAKKYNTMLAGCYYVTFWLSPWIVNFARNLYWVEFTWFIPMLIGLFCSWRIGDQKYRIASYIAAFVSVAGKCLCGYEYISTIMMGLVAFLLVDLVLAITRKDKENTVLLFRSIIIIGCAALAGFMAAVCIHASLRGSGSIFRGIIDIFENDVLRRTSGADLNAFDTVYWPSFNASVWEVFCKYFHFPTEIITGLAGNIFSLLCIVPLCIFGYEYKNKKINIELFTMYIVFFLAAISWFCLAKSHSYIHLTMNYVLWYFGYVQVCLYVIIKKIVDMGKGTACKKGGKKRI